MEREGVFAVLFCVELLVLGKEVCMYIRMNGWVGGYTYNRICAGDQFLRFIGISICSGQVDWRRNVRHLV